LLGTPRSGDAWAQPGDPAAAWIRWVGVAPAGMERGGGAAEVAAGAVELGGYWVDRGMNNVPLSKLISRSSDLNLREEGVKVEDAFGEAKGSIAVATFYQS